MPAGANTAKNGQNQSWQLTFDFTRETSFHPQRNLQTSVVGFFLHVDRSG